MPVIKPFCDDLNFMPVSSGVPSFVRRVTGVSPGLKIEHGQSKRVVCFVTGIRAGGGACFITLKPNLFTMLLCEIINEKRGSVRKKITLRLLAEADKVVRMTLHFWFYNNIG